MCDNKGKLNGKCNVTACTSDKPATYYNHSTREHYCINCAMRINTDTHNYVYAQKTWGHNMCTKVEQNLNKLNINK